MTSKRRALLTYGLSLAAITLFVLTQSAGCKEARRQTPQARTTSNEAAATAEPASDIQWQPSLPAALAAAKAEGKPVFVDFYADWCGYCKMFDSRTLTDHGVKRALADFVALQVDKDKAPQVATAYGVEPIPAMFVLDADGKVLLKALGYMPPEAFIQFLSEGRSRFGSGKNPTGAAAGLEP